MLKWVEWNCTNYVRLRFPFSTTSVLPRSKCASACAAHALHIGGAVDAVLSFGYVASRQGLAVLAGPNASRSLPRLVQFFVLYTRGMFYVGRKASAAR